MMFHVNKLIATVLVFDRWKVEFALKRTLEFFFTGREL